MKVLSLCQPYASLLILGLKKFETRGWRPGARNMEIIKKEGLLIHASLSKKHMEYMGQAPFSNYLSVLGKMPFGAIIGHCRLGEIIRTEQWWNERSVPCHPDNALKDEFWEESRFGDYEDGRYAWEIIDPQSFPEPIPFKGSLSLWNYPYQIKQQIPELI